MWMYFNYSLISTLDIKLPIWVVHVLSEYLL